MTAFERMIKSVFSNKDFLEQCSIQGIKYKCIHSTIGQGFSITQTGLEDEENFTLDLALPLFRMPKINQKVMYKRKQYKISQIQTDSADASIKLYLIALSKNIG